MRHSYYFCHSTILQHLLWECCARHLAKCKSVCFTKEKHRSCLKVITIFCGHFISDFLSAYRWVGLKLFVHPFVKFFDKRVGFCWRAYINLGIGFMCADSVMGPFIDTTGTTISLIAFDERGITYLAATNTGWLPYLTDEGICFVHYSANSVRRQFRLDQDIPDDFIGILESTTSI